MGALGTSADPRYPLLLKRKIIEAIAIAQKTSSRRRWGGGV